MVGGSNESPPLLVVFVVLVGFNSGSYPDSYTLHLSDFLLKDNAADTDTAFSATRVL